MYKINNRKRGFTLLEILLVIAVIGILASIVIVAINPTRQLGQARNATRLANQVDIQKAINQYAIKNEGNYPSGIPSGSYKDICPTGITSNCVDLSVLVPSYIPKIPLDPSGGNYQIAINIGNGQISLKSPMTELGKAVIINPPITFAKSAGGGAGAYIYDTSVASLVDGSSIVTGVYQSPIILGAGEANQTSLNVGSGVTAMFIAKYNANGSLAWAKKAAETGTIEVRKIKVFSDGNIIITGDFFQGASFGETGQVSLTSSINAANDLADYSSFIAKYNNTGNLIWVKNVKSGSYPNPAYNNSGGIDIFSDGSSMMTGTFYGPNARFADGEANQTTLTISPGQYSSFIAKYNANGNLAWVKKVNNALGGWYGGNTISTNSDGSSIVTGCFYNTAIFGEGEANQTSLTTSGQVNVFIAKYNANGTLAWAKGAGSVDYSSYSRNVSTNPDGSSVVIGSYQGTNTIFGLGEPNQTTLPYAATEGGDAFIAKYNANGTLAWVKNVSGTSYIYLDDISSFVDGSILIGGALNGSSIFGVGGLNPITLTNSIYDMFVVKYNANGTLAWAKGVGGLGYWGMNLSTFLDNSFVTVGTFENNTTFGLGDPGVKTLTSTGPGDMFIVKYDKDGVLSAP